MHFFVVWVVGAEATTAGAGAAVGVGVGAVDEAGLVRVFVALAILQFAHCVGAQELLAI